MDDKKFTFALMVPGVWLVMVAFLAVYTILSPILFIAAWVTPYSGPVDLIEQITGESLDDIF